MLEIGRDGEHGFSRYLKQETIDHLFVVIGDVGNLGWQCEHQMEVADRQGLSGILCLGRFHLYALKAFFEENGELVFRLDPFARWPFPGFDRVAENQI